jgi:hypothetical protein
VEIIYCQNCRRSGRFKVFLELTYETSRCECCLKSDDRKWRYYFCSAACQFEWAVKEDIATKGVECQHCRKMGGDATGFLGGYESNGICTTCNGKKRVQV